MVQNKGIFWNSKCLITGLAKYRFLRMKEQKLDFIAVLEIEKKDFSKTEIISVGDKNIFGIGLKLMAGPVVLMKEISMLSFA